MASRVNTKFLSVLVVAVLGLMLLLGGLWYYRMKTNVERHIRAGDAFMAAGQYRDAYKAYGRAVDKKRGNIEHIATFEKALLMVTPLNPDDARQMYSRRMRVLQNHARYRSTDPAAHLDLINEAQYAAVLSGSTGWWAEVHEAADKMEQQLPATEPRRIDARLYRAMAIANQPLVVTDEELAAAQADAEAYLEVHADSDAGWDTLLQVLMVQLSKARVENQTGRAVEIASRLAEARAEALAAVPDQPMAARRELMLLMSDYEASLDTVGQATDETATSREELAEATRRVIDLARASEDQLRIVEAGRLARSLGWLGCMPQAIEVLEGHLEAHPDDLIARGQLVELLFAAGSLEEAEAQIAIVRDGEPMTVSFEAQYQDDIQTNSASLLVDIAFRRWELAEGSERSRAIEDMRARLAELETMTADLEQDAQFVRGRAKLAFARGEYRAAAAHFDQLGRGDGATDIDVLLYGALSLERINEVGLAYERMATLQKLYPLDPRFAYESARLAYLFKRFDLAKARLAELRRLDPENVAGQRLASAIAVEESGGEVADLDPVSRAMAVAMEAVEEGEVEAARATLEGLLAEQPDNLPLLDTLMRVELRAGRPEQASIYLDRLLEFQPDNPSLRRFKAAIDNDDPIAAVAQYVDSLSLDEGNRAVSMLISYGDLATSQRSAARILGARGADDRAEQATSLAERAAAESAAWLQKALSLAPENDQLIRYQFRQAVIREDWTEAEAIVRRARELNSDLAGGELMDGQLRLLRGDAAEAVPLLAEATRRIPHSSAAWKALAAAHNEVGDYGQALTAYERAYGNNPNDVMTITPYVGLLVRTGESVRALGIMRQAHRLLPNDRRVTEVWLGLEAETGDRVLALGTRIKRYEERPDDVTNAAQLARLYSTITPVREVILDDRGRERYSDFSWSQMTTAQQRSEIEKTRAAWYARADEMLETLVAERGDSLELVALKAQLLKERGEVDAGELVLRTFVEGRSAGELTIPMVLAHSQYLADIGKLDAAIDAINRGRRNTTDSRGALDLALGSIYMTRADVGSALEAYERALEAGDDPAAELHVIECLSKLERFAEAERRLETYVESREAGYFERMLAAEIADGRGAKLHREGRTDEAERSYERRDEAYAEAKRLNPSTERPYVAQAQAMLRAFDREIAGKDEQEIAVLRRRSRTLDDAMAVLDEAEQVTAGAAGTSLARASILEAKGDRAAAIGELTRLVERDPDESTSRRRLVMLQYMSGDFAPALSTLDTGIRRNPTLAAWHELRGDLCLDRAQRPAVGGAGAARDTGELAAQALASYERAVELRPTQPLVGRRSEARLSLAPPDARGVLALVAEHEDLVRSNPVLRSLHARALHGAGRRPEAMEELAAAYALLGENAPAPSPDDIARWYRAVTLIFDGRPMDETEAFVLNAAGPDPDAAALSWIAARWVDAGAEFIDRAIDVQTRAIARGAGEDPAVRLTLDLQLAEYMLQAGRMEAAVDPIKRALDIDPYHKHALNNLSYLLAEYLGRPQEGLEFARRLADLIDDEVDPVATRASFLDSVGWVHHLSGQDDQAEGYLRQSVQLEEKAGNVLHLARVLAAQGKLDRARQWLERAAELATDSRTREEIDRLADDIRTRRNR